MAQKFLNNFKMLEEYENIHAKWCAGLIANGRQTLQSVCNIIDNDLLTNLVDSFMRFVLLLAQCHPHSLSNKKISYKPSDLTSKQQNESQDLLPKNDIIKMMNSDLQCPICNEWLFKATSANCNHTFCETCIKKWLKINKTCPVCRTSIQYTSTSIAVDNFITNLCHLFGGFTKERRESIINAHIGDMKKKTNADITVNEPIIGLNINQSIEEDTFSIQNDTTFTMLHPNMARLIPFPQTPISRENSREPIVSPSIPHPNQNNTTLTMLHANIARLVPFPQTPISRENSRQPIVSPNIPNPNQNDTTLTMLHSNIARLVPFPQTPIPRENSRQPIVSPNILHPNTAKLLPFPQSSIASKASPRFKRLQQTSSTYVLSSHVNRFQPNSPVSVVSPCINHIHPTTSTSVASPCINHIHPTTSTSVANSNISRLRTNTNIGSSPRYHSNIGGLQNIRYY